MADSIRVTCVISSLGCGGAERVMVGLAPRLAALGYRVTVLSTDPSVPDHFQLPTPVARRVAPPDAARSCRFYDWRCQRRRTAALRAAILEDQPQVVISFMDRVNVAVLMALAGSGVPVLAAEHTDPRRHAIGWRWSLLRRVWYPEAAQVVMLTEDTGRWAKAQWPRWRTCVIPNPVDTWTGEADPKPDYFGAHTVLAMGRLGPEKGYDQLLWSFAGVASQFPDWKLVIFGEGAERTALEDLRLELGLVGRVELPGQIEQPGRFLAHADVFALSSRYEGFPMALVESMAAGLPVVAFKYADGLSEILRSGEDGFLVAPGDLPAYSEALTKLMGNAERRQRMSDHARKVAGRYAPARVVGLWRDLIESVARR